MFSTFFRGNLGNHIKANTNHRREFIFLCAGRSEKGVIERGARNYVYTERALGPNSESDRVANPVCPRALKRKRPQFRTDLMMNPWLIMVCEIFSKAMEWARRVVPRAVHKHENMPRLRT